MTHRDLVCNQILDFLSFLYLVPYLFPIWIKDSPFTHSPKLEITGHFINVPTLYLVIKMCLFHLINVLLPHCPIFRNCHLSSGTVIVLIVLPASSRSLPLPFIFSTVARVTALGNSWLRNLLFFHGLQDNAEIPQCDPSLHISLLYPLL